MKWTYSIKNKLVASIVLIALCLLVLLSNYLDQLHTENVKNSISTMYDDRLVVENYILKMAQNTYEIREILQDNEKPDLTNAMVNLTKEFNTTFAIFSKTKLTKIEKETADELIGNFKKLEDIISRSQNVPFIQTDSILASLTKLSVIQLDESKLIMQQVESQYAAIKVTSQFAFALIIVILIVLQILVFSGESLIPLFKTKDASLN
ncbi:MCP four helix bundle domain-containing protein [Flavobacterium tegetincola]|uniref:MCP four helix bundle domain-containing protein n=1 Tax=Flavobacterium tegetincola TaxID=150172 RepID=UPI00047E72AF|nr:MCP four helix bundle domain-containing protein [Flavobacterium tegetincola]